LRGRVEAIATLAHTLLFYDCFRAPDALESQNAGDEHGFTAESMLIIVKVGNKRIIEIQYASIIKRVAYGLSLRCRDLYLSLQNDLVVVS